MPDYIIPHNGKIEHYFYNPYEGICCTIKSSNQFSTSKTIYRDGLDGFCIYKDSFDYVHMISSNKNGDLIYFINRNGEWHKHLLNTGNNKVFPKTIKLTFQNGRLNLIYSAKYNDEMILIYCILGVNSQPQNIAKLSSENSDFCIYDTNVYFTNSKNVLGYMDFTDGKPEIFMPIAPNANTPSVISYDDRTCIVYKSEDNIFFNNELVFEDKLANKPILCNQSGKLIILWKCVNFIRYTTSQNGGSTWSAPMRFLNTENTSQIYYIQLSNEIYSYYGIPSGNDVSVLCAPDFYKLSHQNTSSFVKTEDNANKQSVTKENYNETVFHNNNNNNQEHSEIELQKLKIMIDMIKNDVIELKSTITTLKDLIDTMNTISKIVTTDTTNQATAEEIINNEPTINE